MRRRKLLEIAGIAGIGGLAGCTDSIPGMSGSESTIQDSDGDGVIDSEDYAPQDPDVQEKSDITGNNSGSKESTPTETATTNDRTETKDRLIKYYKQGRSEYGDDIQILTAAMNHVDNDDLDSAHQSAKSARGGFKLARTKFDAALGQSKTLNNSDASDICKRAYSSADAMHSAADTLLTAIEYLQNGNKDKADEAIGDVGAYLQAAENSSPRKVSRLKAAIGR